MSELNLIDLINTNNYAAILENENLFDYKKCDERGNSPFLLACDIQNLDIIILIFKHIDIFDIVTPNCLKQGYLTILSKNIKPDTYKIYQLLKDKNILNYKNLCTNILRQILHSLLTYKDTDIYKIFDIILPYLLEVPFFKYGYKTIRYQLLTKAYKLNLLQTVRIFLKYFSYDEFISTEFFNTDIKEIINSSSYKIFNIILNYIYNNNSFKIRDKEKLLKYICKYSTSTDILNELLFYFDISKKSDIDFMNSILKNNKLNIEFREIISNHSIDYLLK